MIEHDGSGCSSEEIRQVYLGVEGLLEQVPTREAAERSGGTAEAAVPFAVESASVESALPASTFPVGAIQAMIAPSEALRRW